MKNFIAIVFLLLILSHFSLAEDQNKGSVASGTGIGQMPRVNEVTRLGKNPLMAEYMPLDKGNVWTYEIKKEGKTHEHTQKIVSESAGWSVFDNYFGMEDVSLRIAPGGELLVTRRGVVSSFYSDEVIISFPEDPVSTPKGEFQDVMVVKVPEGKAFWFRDIYVKGVGLVYHEHQTPIIHSSYTLKSAKVGGSSYPPKSP